MALHLIEFQLQRSDRQARSSMPGTDGNDATRPLLATAQSQSQSQPKSQATLHPLAKPTLRQRQSSTFKYHTFPTAPPRNPGKKPSKDGMQQADPTPLRSDSHASTSTRPTESSGTSPPPPTQSSSRHSEHHETPLPKRQLAILAIIALAEQTALNSISPYLPEMASTFPDIGEGQVGLYVGLIASSFALAQFATNFAWGWLSDRIGRKPVVLFGTIATASCFVAFGFCRTLWQAIIVQVAMGLVNGNQGVISTCLGEITDRSNQSRAFTYLPVIYGLGGITGPIVGGLLVMKQDPFHPDRPNPYPYLLPNALSAVVLVLDFIITMIFLEESLEEARDLPPLGQRVGSLFTWLWQFTSSHRPTYIRRSRKHVPKDNSYRTINSDGIPEDIDEDLSDDSASLKSAPNIFPSHGGEGNGLTTREVLTRDTVLLLASFLIFQLSNISYNSLYPIYAQADAPTGRDLSPEEIGVSLAFAGAFTIVFQIGIFGRLREKVGNKATYRAGLGLFVMAFLLMPFVGYKNGSHDGNPGPATTAGKIWLWIELGGILVIKTIASVGSLTSALLLITNSAPSHAVLGTLNGLAQTLSAAGRAVGPFISGSLFTAATKIEPKGELLPFGIFGGIAFLGFLMSFWIRGAELEADGWDEEQGSGDDDGNGDEEEGRR